MCLLVWVGTSRPVLHAVSPPERDGLPGFDEVVEVLPDALVRARLGTPHVAYVASHTGCGCGYNSRTAAAGGRGAVADVLPFVNVMREEERAEFLAAQRSRERLQALVNAALEDGPVHVYACAAGDEDAPAASVERVPDARWLTTRTEPLRERVLYVVASRPRPSRARFEA